MFATRLWRIGRLSLSALFFGGVLLFLAGLNRLIGPDSMQGKSPSWNQVHLFSYGSRLSVQSWLAIIGVGFGLLSYGFHETYVHLFDWWCSSRAQSDGGLDHGLYLNSQLQAPVLYGRRGFTGFITLRYLLALASIAASIGYKFGIIETKLKYVGQVPYESNVNITRPSFERSSEDGNPWLMDKPDYSLGVNRAFYHEAGEAWGPPSSTIMAGTMRCFVGGLPALGIGTVYSREYVIVANMTEHSVEDEGIDVESGLYVTDDDWVRTYTLDVSSSGGWFNSTEIRENAVVEFRYDRLDQIHVRWAKYVLSNYYIDKGKWPVVRHVEYKLHHAVAEVRRRIENGTCSILEPYDTPIQILSVDDMSPEPSFFPVNENFDEWIWARSMLTTWGGNPRDGVSGILQVGMTLFTSWMEKLSVESNSFYPFGELVPLGAYAYGAEPTPHRLSGPQGKLRYPFLSVEGWTATGIMVAAAYAFVVIGCLSISVAIFRVYVGPPVLTSWMGQHIFLAQSGTVSMPQQDLASGYKSAQTGLGRLRLRKERMPVQ
ncbi:hypothetical protein B0J13DRAFT_635326 [Dactylonectria estremocensis]|uniref:Uncharacterized protein n=1 Tax=Dactylonectria estremocensis TaxID=1079267 RepID=A0A9P9EUQ5_9HYPO|nr:hypothetical protein B0J13DRAFT_635326 [Dactylonectria estremocensis]